ncbi:MAG: 50S ribosomal protein L21 [Leptolyngbyaceae cyanobacterium]
MTYAIIEASGKQFRVEPGRFYDFDRLPVEEDGNVNIDKVLFVSHDGETFVGQPLVEGATVSGTVMRHLRGKKIIVYKMKPKKKTRKKRGHRQELTRLMIDAISLNGEVLAGAATTTGVSTTSASAGSATSPSESSQSESSKAEDLETQVKLPQNEDAAVDTTVVVEEEDIPENIETTTAEPLAETATDAEAAVAAIDEPVVVADDSVPAVAEVAADADTTATEEE